MLFTPIHHLQCILLKQVKLWHPCNRIGSTGPTTLISELRVDECPFSTRGENEGLSTSPICGKKGGTNISGCHFTSLALLLDTIHVQSSFEGRKHAGSRSTFSALSRLSLQKQMFLFPFAIALLFISYCAFGTTQAGSPSNAWLETMQGNPLVVSKKRDIMPRFFSSGAQDRTYRSTSWSTICGYNRCKSR